MLGRFAFAAAVAAVFVVAAVCQGVHGRVHMVNGEAYAPTPQGYMLARCMHEVASGTHVESDGAGRLTLTHPSGTVEVHDCDTDGGRVPLLLPKAAVEGPEVYDGWQAYTTYEYPDGLDVFVGDISTPNGKPHREPEVLFIFTGLQNVNWIPIVDPEPAVFDILQPVLQYPATAVLDDEPEDPAFGGSWGVRSWYVTLHSGAVYSKVALLDDGDVVFGNMTRTGPTEFFVGSTNKANGQAVTISAKSPRLASQPWAYVTLETYGAPDCHYVPDAPSKFTNMVLAKGASPVSASWDVHASPSARCPGSKCVVLNSATVTIDMAGTD